MNLLVFEQSVNSRSQVPGNAVLYHRPHQCDADGFGLRGVYLAAPGLRNAVGPT